MFIFGKSPYRVVAFALDCNIAVSSDLYRWKRYETSNPLTVG